MINVDYCQIESEFADTAPILVNQPDQGNINLDDLEELDELYDPDQEDIMMELPPVGMDQGRDISNLKSHFVRVASITDSPLLAR